MRHPLLLNGRLQLTSLHPPVANGFIPTLGRRHDGPNGIHRISCAFDDGHGACPCSAEVTEFGCSGGSTSVSTTSVNLAHSHPPPAVDPAEFETYKQRATPRRENLREFLLEAIEKDFNRLHRADSSREGYENEDPDSSWSLASQAEALVQAYEDAFDYRAAKEMYRSLRKKNYVVSFYGGVSTFPFHCTHLNRVLSLTLAPLFAARHPPLFLPLSETALRLFLSLEASSAPGRRRYDCA